MNKNINYKNHIINSEIFDYYPIKGCFILPPNGLIIWEEIKKKINSLIEKYGVENVLFPTMIPLSMIEMEKDHLKGFSPELFILNKKSEDEEKNILALRPTSETAFHSWFEKKLSSYKELPFLYNQWTSVFRMEKNVAPFFRNTEFLWQEGHTLHKEAKEAKSFTLKIINTYKSYAEKFLYVPVIKGKKTKGEKFAGALESYTIESILPDNQFLQLATSHYLGQNFSEIFKVSYRDIDNKIKTPFSTSWGTSSRAIGSLVMNHCRKEKIIFPFDIAPIQISIVKIGKDELINSYYKKVSSTLKKRKIRSKLYLRNDQFSLNMKEAEKEGSPFIIIIGKNELKEQSVCLINRSFDKDEKINLPIKQIFSFIKEKKLISSVNSFNDNKKRIDLITRFEKNLDFIKNEIKSGENKFIFLSPFCDRIKCEEKAQEQISPYTFRCISLEKNIELNKCLFCSFKTKKIVYIGRSY